MISKVTTKSKRFVLNGIFGIFKESGDSVDDYRQWIRLTLHNESQFQTQSKGWNSPSLFADINPRFAEPFSTGVLCVGLGYWSVKWTALTNFWTHEYIITAKLGTETQEYWSGSAIVRELPFKHVSHQLLNEKVKNFIGIKEQFNPPYIWKESLLIPKNPPKEKTEKDTEYPTYGQRAPRLRECHNIEVLSFEPPDLKLKVVSDGLFSCRAFVHDLGHNLNTCAHLTSLHLNRMGVITGDHCLKKYELHINQIKEAIDKYSKLYEKDLKRFEGLKKFSRRVV